MKSFPVFAFYLLLFFLFVGCERKGGIVRGDGVTDIDGNTYPTVIIGNQEWMEKNLRTSRYQNGDPILNVPDSRRWGAKREGAWAWYDDEEFNNELYGKLYNGFAATDERNVCPAGWRVSTDEDWKILEMFLGMRVGEADSTGWRGGKQHIGGKLKKRGFNHWQSPNIEASNESRFTALPAGNRNINGEFVNKGAMATWWTSTRAEQPNFLWRRSVYHINSFVLRYTVNKRYGFSIRCVKKEGPGLD